MRSSTSPTPDAVLANIAACIASKKPMVVGTTGWYGELDRVRQEVEQAGTGFVFGANFSYGVNLFFQIAQAAAPALQHGYSGHITERHHIHKKDAPSGTAVALQRVVAAGVRSAGGHHVRARRRRDWEYTRWNSRRRAIELC